MSIDQSRVIENLNSYLQWNNLPLRVNVSGICNGLAMVYAKYALENKTNDFLELLHYVAGKKIILEMEEGVNLFIIEIVLACFPEQFDQKLNQQVAMQTLRINEKPLQSAFDFAITTSDKNWEEIIKSIGLQENEVMRVASINHTVCVERKNGKYVVYDPNYSSGRKVFSSEQKLIRELHHQVFHYNKGPLGMMLNVIPHPDNSLRAFPKISALYDKYLNSNNINAVAITDSLKFSTLKSAATINDDAVIEHLFSLGAIDKGYKAAGCAVMDNNTKCLKTLLSHIDRKQRWVMPTLFLSALENGREEAFDLLYQLHKCLPHNQGTAIYHAAKGGNPVLLKKVMNLYRENITLTTSAGDLLISAIRSGSVGCVRLLMTQFRKQGVHFNEQKIMHYLLESVRSNQPEITSFFIEYSTKIPFKAINMSTSAVERTHLSILHQLKRSGVIFSETANAVIEQKEHRAIGILLTIGILLYKFTDFCKEVLQISSGYGYHPKFFNLPSGATANQHLIISDCSIKS